MNRGKIALLVVAALVFLSLGFVIGQVVQAVDTLPGSTDDPVATQSYVETKVGEKLAVLNTKIEELEAEVAALKGSGATAANNNASNTTDNSSGNTASSNVSSTSQVQITGNSINVRATASTSAAIIGSLSKDDKVTLLQESGSWYQVQLKNGTTGWISASLAKKL